MASQKLIIIIISFFVLVSSLFLIVQIPRNEWALVKIKNASLLVEVVSDHPSQIKGLSGRNNLAQGRGMLFLFDKPDYYNIWMKEMRFPIDILWLKNGRVVDFEENVPPPKAGEPDEFLPIYHSDVPAQFVLETNAGLVKKDQISIGDDVKIIFSKE